MKVTWETILSLYIMQDDVLAGVPWVPEPQNLNEKKPQNLNEKKLARGKERRKKGGKKLSFLLYFFLFIIFGSGTQGMASVAVLAAKGP